MPKLKELRARYGDQGLVLIGIHSTKDAEGMQAFVEAKGIDYPVAIDLEDATKRAYAVDSYPDYYLIDRAGKLRVADLANGDLERAVIALLGEPAPYDSPVPASFKRAAKKNKRVLVLWGSAQDRAGVDGQLKGDLRSQATNEYEVLRLTRANEPELAKRWRAGETGLAACVLAADGTLLGNLAADVARPDRLRQFLATHQIPQKDAEALWKQAKQQALAQQKNLLVHLGAPW